ncbi:metal-sensitive transcriptional regulator [Heliophilum fasciatum]|uniref:DNA-binding FrmR family transcriptional regulator n=1 Tax=Heliophilum fasciatum TaxID=35700 RepID=A0A4R2RMY3_9FIRM|nr:metal-sensitive transcriptional regulator [Heliophilum fasciatum]MCW2278052.1 DNA-binding FrmR family transcriptional regulator [Heliophilum fasciatum]TCP64328.1 DNA-binding FrmR family transcriptional regulator [Heliophilum fasciatum]
MNCTHSKEAVLRRLKKIEGQVKGIQRMIDEEQSCIDILVQVTAVRAAINRVGTIIVMNQTRKCLGDVPMTTEQEQVMEKLLGELSKFSE